ncbi:MAG TPA: MFS transporter [Ignavibacteria bacterium]|nr:MFS transporter [Ignavibacteria bacterium]HRF66614.1 MFS transporter [Ignavibacteria bacterium]
MNNESSGLHSLEKKTFTLHLISQIFGGIAIGVVLLQDVILKKTLGGSDFQVMILSLLVSSAFLFSIYGSELVNRSHSRAKTILIIGIAAKSFLIILPLFEDPVYYIACIAIGAYLDALLLSIWNIVFKHNYSDKNRSKLYSYATTFQTVFVLIVTTLSGYLLDMNSSIYKILFPAAGVFGILVYVSLARMINLSMDDYSGRIKKQKTYYNFRLLKDIAILPLRNTARIFRENKPFLRFEAYFFLYGMAFMVLSPVIPVFLVDDLKLSYSPISFARGLIFHSALIIFTPLMGRFHGIGNPTRFCGYIFSFLALFPLILVSAKHFVSLGLLTDTNLVVYISFFVFGFAMSGVTIAWALSSIYYAPKNEVSNYQAVHITLTGVRGVFSPALGYAVMMIFDIEYSFYLSAFLFLLGGIMMWKESKKLIKN